MTSIPDFIHRQAEHQKEILFFFHRLLTEELGLTPKIRYKIPFYYGQSWICYLNPIEKEGVELAFLRGNELSNVQGLLDSKDRKQVSGIEFQSLADIPQTEVYEIIQEAILLDEQATPDRHLPPV